MAFDFPSSPTDGQIVTFGSVRYRWVASASAWTRRIEEVMRTRPQLVAWLAAGGVPEAGKVYFAGNQVLIGAPGSSVIPDLPGMIPDRLATYPDHWTVNAIPGTTDMAPAAQAATNWLASVGGGILHFGRAIYAFGSSVTGLDQVPWEGLSRELTGIFRRHSGSTYVQVGGECKITGIEFTHATYIPQATNLDVLDDRLTNTAAHIDLTGCRQVTIEANRLERMPYLIKLDGCDNVEIVRNEMMGTWHPTNPAMQETVASVWLGGARTDYQQIVRMTGNRCTGTVGPKVDTTYNDGTEDRIRAQEEGNWGPKHHVLGNNFEMLTLTENYFNRASVSLIEVDQLNDWPTYGLRAVANEFDAGSCNTIAGQNVQVVIRNRIASRQIRQITLSSNLFIGGSKGVHAILIEDRADAPGDPTAFGVIISNNQMLGYIGTPILLDGVKGFSITGNVITGYNWLDFGNNNPDYVSGIRVSSACSKGRISGNTIGGGSTNFGNAASKGFNGVWLANPDDASVHCSDNTWGDLNAGGMQTNWNFNRNVSTANGYYRKTPDGHLVCWNNALSLGYLSGVVLGTLWTYPHVFAENPVISCQPSHVDLAAISKTDGVGPVMNAATTIAGVQIRLPKIAAAATFSVGQSVGSTIRAEGRWAA